MRSRGPRCFKHKARKTIARKPIKVRKPKIIQGGRPPEKKHRSIRYLKGVVWKQVSLFIRLRDSNKKGFGKCITCDNVEYYKFADAGHGIRRKHNATLYHEMNLGLQCKGCNQVKDGMEEEFAKATDERYGPGTWDNLKALSRTTKRFSVQELEEMLEHYTTEVARMLKEKEK